jgi:hypothetical protein
MPAAGVGQHRHGGAAQHQQRRDEDGDDTIFIS